MKDLKKGNTRIVFKENIMETSKNLRILYILKYLHQNTDDNHYATANEIVEHLQTLGTDVNRRTVINDISLLSEYGIDIVETKSTQNRYQIASRIFELSELKLLVDAVQSSRFITEAQSKTIIDKLTSLTSKYNAKDLNRSLYVDKRVKPLNETVLYTVDLIQECINTKKTITFQYYNYNEKKERILKHKGQVYEFCPYDLIWNDDSYYVVGFSFSHTKVVKFRVDRIHNPQIVDTIYMHKSSTYNISRYSKEVFQMYDGKTYVVKLKCKKHLMNTIIDRFGEDVKTEIYDNKHFIATVEISASPTFYSWLFTFAGEVTIISPTEVSEEYKNLLKKAISDL